MSFISKKKTPKNQMLFIKCVDLPHTIIDGFQKTVSHFSDILPCFLIIHTFFMLILWTSS